MGWLAILKNPCIDLSTENRRKEITNKSFNQQSKPKISAVKPKYNNPSSNKSLNTETLNAESFTIQQRLDNPSWTMKGCCSSQHLNLDVQGMKQQRWRFLKGGCPGTLILMIPIPGHNHTMCASLHPQMSGKNHAASVPNLVGWEVPPPIV